jgi:hypothetical protein
VFTTSRDQAASSAAVEATTVALLVDLVHTDRAKHRLLAVGSECTTRRSSGGEELPSEGEKGGEGDGNDVKAYLWSPGPMLTDSGDGGVGGEGEPEATLLLTMINKVIAARRASCAGRGRARESQAGSAFVWLVADG